MSVKVIPYKFGSRSGRALAEGLRAAGLTTHRVRRDSGTYRFRQRHALINWGCSTLDIDYGDGENLLNKPERVAAASNKLEAFRIMQRADVAIPEFTIDVGVARTWDASIVSRGTLTGHSGRGISIVGAGELPEFAPLYVKYIKKQSEYRVHVFAGEVIDIQQKRKRQETPNEEVDYQIRSHDNGWVFCRDGITEPQGIRELSLAAVQSLGLDFGAVDVVFNQRANQCYVLEVNTAVGMENTTVTKYVDAIQNLMEAE